jgi:muramoyltetrapeptide carboxypeptidase LdcA involved in peptidoglycan recycling
MGQDKGQVGAAVGDEKTPEEIRREIEATRQELGDTAAALAAKTDVKTRAKEKVEDVKQTIAQKKESFSSNAPGDVSDSSRLTEIKTKAQENPIPTAAIAAFIGGFLFGRLTSR